MELKKLYQDKEKSVSPKEEFWQMIEDHAPACPLEEDILLSYCRTMTPNQRKWVLYTFIKGMSAKEIAELEQVSVSAVKNWSAGAKEKVRKLVRN